MTDTQTQARSAATPQSDRNLPFGGLDRAALMLITAIAILVVLAFLGRLGWTEAVLGAFVLWATRLVLPSRAKFAATPIPLEAKPETDAIGTTMDALVSPAFLLDHRTTVLHRNPAATTQFAATTIGQPLTFTIRHPEVHEAIETAIATGLPEQASIRVASTPPQWYAVSVAPLPANIAGAEQGPFLLAVFENQTELKRMETMRVDFIANASHELRTPLTSVIGFIDTLIGPAANDVEARLKFLGLMRGQAERMSNLIEDLLSLSRIEMRQHVRPQGTTDLVALMQEVIEGQQLRLDAEGLDLTFSHPDHPTKVSGDHDELYQVFENLLDNAIKYGADGKTVEVVLIHSTGGQSGLATLSIEDHGPGIAPEHVPRLTERFYRVDAESSRKKKGTGLGLAIVKHIVSRHRGTLSIKSAPGIGTRVEVNLPLEM